MVLISIRNTFLHCECTEGSEEQPPLRRFHTAPLPHAKDCWEKESDSRPELPRLLRRARQVAPAEVDSCGTRSEVAQHGDSALPQPAQICEESDSRPELPRLLGRARQVALAEVDSCGTRSEVVQHGDSALPQPAEICEATAHSGSDASLDSKQPVGRSSSCIDKAQCTTVMLQNLPNSFTRDNLLELLICQGFHGRFDFLYLPIDFETHSALGYAFVNLCSPADARDLSRSLAGFSNWSIPNCKTCKISWSKPLQGLEAHVRRYRNSPLMHHNVPEHYRPMLFNCGMQVPLPPPTKKIRPPRKGTQRMLV